MKVLVVEDNDDTRELIKTMLQIKGCQVIEATDGVEAVKVARREKPDLILMDLNMPVMDGCEAINWITTQEETRNIPVAVISAQYDSESREKAMAAGAICFLQKPVDPATLDALIG